MSLKKAIACFSVTALFLGVIVSFSSRAVGQEVSASSATNVGATISFPVSELGNCTDKDSCRQYCNETEHISACVSFAKAHGLMNKEEGDRAERFSKKIVGGSGPGGCSTPEACRTFCEDVANIDVCVSFAKSQGVKNTDIEQGSRISDYIKKGGKLPGGCTSRSSCQTYCGDFSHAQECADFAKNAGIVQSSGENGNLPPEKLQKFVEAIKNGQTPGGCTSKESCEKYCSESVEGRRQECVAFGVKAGLIDPKQQEAISSEGFQGPGGCSSPESCRQYCTSHAQECFDFAKKFGFSSGDIQKTQDSFVSVRAGFEHAPPEVSSCLESSVGEQTLEDIQSGKLVPDSEIGRKVHDCFEKFGQNTGGQNVLRSLPASVASCVKEKVGENFIAIQSGKTQPTPEQADAIRLCFQSNQFGSPQNGSNTGQNRQSFKVEDFQRVLRTAPPEVVSCLKEKFGDFIERVESGELGGVPDTSAMKQCFEAFRPGEEHMMQGQQGSSTGQFPPREQSKQGGEGHPMMQLPPQYENCAREIFGEDGVEKLMKGQYDSSMKEKLAKCVQNSEGQQFPPSSSTTIQGQPGLPGQGSPGTSQPGTNPCPPNDTQCMQKMMEQYKQQNGGCTSGQCPPPPQFFGGSSTQPQSGGSFSPCQPGQPCQYPGQFPQSQSTTGQTAPYPNQPYPSGSSTQGAGQYPPPPSGQYPQYPSGSGSSGYPPPPTGSSQQYPPSSATTQPPPPSQQPPSGSQPPPPPPSTTGGRGVLLDIAAPFMSLLRLFVP